MRYKRILQTIFLDLLLIFCMHLSIPRIRSQYVFVDKWWVDECWDEKQNRNKCYFSVLFCWSEYRRALQSPVKYSILSIFVLGKYAGNRGKNTNFIAIVSLLHFPKKYSYCRVYFILWPSVAMDMTSTMTSLFILLYCKCLRL